MASTLPLEKMSVQEKLSAMELLRDDLCRHAGGVSSPDWHADVLAVAAQVPRIVTFNARDFGPASRFGIEIVAPKRMLEDLP